MTAQEAINSIQGYFEVTNLEDLAKQIYLQKGPRIALRWLGFISWLLNLWKDHNINCIKIKNVNEVTVLNSREVNLFKIQFARLASM